jgi:uncharacterized protein involved in cysteine biosynthesis
MRNLMLVVRLLDMLTGSGFYEMTRYGANKNNESLFEIIFPWKRRFGRRLHAQEAFHMLAIPIMILSVMTVFVPIVGPSIAVVGTGYFLTAIILVIVLPPVGLAMI